ncbi:MAG: hypothetical protein CMC35_00685 [Flavobacteriaceae bacterium]|nr:hypothetical protein [Flavobacteriaceae bacterium]|tara:strand:- start:31638 stop:34037 length:2400 start_codon:yes stop_codon:yes gene_type:complete
MKCNYLIVIVFYFCLSSSFAQGEKNYWFFGNNAGLDFSSGTATAISGNLNTFEGCASIASSAGDLLFYTDGITVYDPSGSPMTNGGGLLGNPSSTSSAIIVPLPQSTTQYIIFSVDFVNGTNGINYSIVDMDDNGNGVYDPGVDFGQIPAGLKNINLPGPTGERICAVKHSNGQDYWVTATEKNTNTFYTYQITPCGVNTTPQIQSVGPTMSAGYYMKHSPSGGKIARTDGTAAEVYLYDFNTATGVISNPQFVGNAPVRPYGVEFSPNGNILYYTDFANSNGTGTGRIYQVSLSPTIGTPVQIGTIPNQGGRYAVGAMQLTPEVPSRILITKDGENSLAAINNPDVGGASNFVATAVTLTAGAVGHLGLPTFISGEVAPSSCLDFDPFANAAPTIISAAVKNELNNNSFFGKDKEYGDVDNDGDIDILYTKNNDELHILENTAGPGVMPIYNVPGTSAFGPAFQAYSYRFIDWNGDGWNDILVSGIDTATSNAGIWLFINNGSGGFPSNGIPFINAGLTIPDQYAFSNLDLIAVGDLNNDGLHDILISNQSGTLDGTAYFENLNSTIPPYFGLTGAQTFNGSTIVNPFLPDDSGSYHTPEIYDADCDGDLDVLISDPLLPSPTFGGGRMYFHENNGNSTSGTLPDVNITGVDNPFGFSDDPGTSSPLACDWLITRIVPFINPNCPIAISYNLCDEEFYFYNQDCGCEGTGTSVFAIEEHSEINDTQKIYLYPNPAENYVEIVSENPLKRVEIYSITGRLMITSQNSDTTIDIEELPSGIYFVRIATNNLTKTIRLIKS